VSKALPEIHKQQTSIRGLFESAEPSDRKERSAKSYKT
jgi:hypothetical protein